MRRGTTIAAATLAVVAVAAPAWAYYVSSNSVSRAFTAASLSAPGAPTATAPTSTSVNVSWTLPASQLAGAQYVVTRTTGSLAVCTVASTVTSCADPNTVAAGTTYSYSIQAVLPGTTWVTPATAFSVTTPSVAATSFTITTTTNGAIGTQVAGTQFQVRVKAVNGSTVDTGYAGTKSLTFSGVDASPAGTAATINGVAVGTPSNVTFTGGVATVPVTLTDAGASQSITATQGTLTGTSNTFTVNAATASALAFVTSAAGTTVACSDGSVAVGNGGTFTAWVAVRDVYGNLTANGASARTVTLARTPTSGGGNAPSPTSLTVSANANPAVTSASFNGTLPSGNVAATTYTATSSPLTSVSCVVSKN